VRSVTTIELILNYIPMTLGWMITITTTLSNKASIFRAKRYAIMLLIAVIRHSKRKNFIIFSDFMSSLEAVREFKFNDTYLNDSDKRITVFCGGCQAM